MNIKITSKIKMDKINPKFTRIKIANKIIKIKNNKNR